MKIISIAFYMPQKIFEKLARVMYSAAKPDARFCLCEFMSNRVLPPDLQRSLRRNHDLNKKLEREESNFVYRFMAGEVLK
jgi:hypothetical protein